MAWLTRAVGGAAAGAVATGAMSVLMLAAQRAGLLGKMPPVKIVESLLGRARGKRPSAAVSKPLGTLAHLGFGMAAGAAYGSLARRRRRLPAASLRGALYGSMVWLVSYAGWVPALRILPPPTRDRPDRQSTMLAAHLVYGGVLGALSRRC